MTTDSHRPARRCPSCGSRLHGDERRCTICGAQVPWRLTVQGVALESVAALALVVAILGSLWWLRQRSDVTLSEAERVVDRTLVDGPPTPWPTLPPEPTAAFKLPTLLPAGAEAQAPIPPSATAAPASVMVTRTIVSGDTLYDIARENDITLETLVEANKELLGPDIAIHIGDVLQVPRPSDGVQASALVSAPPTQAAENPGSPQGPPEAGAGALGSGSITDPADPANEGSGTLELTNTQMVSAGLASGSPSEATESSADGRLPAPSPLGPGDGVTVTGESVILHWASVGVLPPDTFYAVALRDAKAVDAGRENGPDADSAEDAGDLEWIYSNATALRVPGRLRPALGSSRTIEWAVTVRRRGTDLVGNDRGVLQSPPAEWHRFVWSPSAPSGQATP